MKRIGTFSVKIYGEDIVAIAEGEFSNQFHGAVKLNETGLVLWKALCTDQTVDSLADIIVSEYEIDIDTAKRDVIAFLDVLRTAGLLEE